MIILTYKTGEIHPANVRILFPPGSLLVCKKHSMHRLWQRCRLEDDPVGE